MHTRTDWDGNAGLPVIPSGMPLVHICMRMELTCLPLRLLWDISLWPPPLPMCTLLPTELPLRSVLLAVWLVFIMHNFKIQQIFEHSYEAYSAGNHYQTYIQRKAAHAILNCKRSWITMCICTALFPEEALPKMEKFVSLQKTFLSAGIWCMCSPQDFRKYVIMAFWTTVWSLQT